jgi:FKBP-type peptidyl-prolyl cis-trans isomerase
MKIQFLFLSLLSTFALVSCDKGKDSKIDLKTDDQKMSYVIGQQIGQNFKHDNMKVDPAIIGASIGDVLNNQKPRLSEQEMQATMGMLRDRATAQAASMGKQNKEAEEKFLAENKKKPGVKSTLTGLQYEVLTEGKGPMPKASDEVKVNYRGTLLDGTEFDSTTNAEPAILPLGEIIPGWSEALKMMKVGSKWKLYIPSELAYGERGQSEVPPNSMLTFEIELLEIISGKHK